MLNRRHFLIAAPLTGLSYSLARAEDLPAFGPTPAEGLREADLIYNFRPVIIFADNESDPNFIRQMELLPRVYDDLALRDVILITDTNRETPSEIRKRLRPRGFSLVLMDKDWGSAIRKPLPWEGREIVNAIDKMPIARAESLNRFGAGR